MLPRQKRLYRAAWAALAVVVVSVIAAILVRRFSIANNLTFPAEGQFGIRYWEVARNSYLRGDGFPLWDRHACAGYPFLGNPETPLISSWIAGALHIHGDMMHRWYPTVLAGLGVAGTYLWARRALSVSFLGSLFAGVLFVASGFVSLHGAVRMPFAPFMVIPWVLYFAHAGERDIRAAAGGGAVLGLMLLEGAIFPFCFALVAFAVTTAPRFFSRETTVLAVARMIGIVTVVCVLIGGLKMFPVMAQLARAPRVMKDLDQGPWSDLIPMLGDADRLGMPGRHYHVNEFRGYIGPLALGMAIAGAGVSLILEPRRIGLVILLFVAAILTRGAYAPSSPWNLLTRLSPFDQLQVPSRFVVLVALAAVVCAAIALDAATRAVKRPLLVAPIVLAAAFALYDPIAAGQKVLKANVTDPWLPRPDPVAGKYHLVPGDDFARNATYPERNVGSAQCHKSWPYSEGSGYAIGDVPQAIVDNGRVAAVEVRANQTIVDAALNAPGALHLNQTFDPDFVSNVGTPRKSARGSLDVALPAGTQRVVVRYRPSGMTGGSIATISGVALLIALLVLRPLRALLRRS